MAGDVHEHNLGQTHNVESGAGNRLQREAAKVGATLLENVPDPAENDPHCQEWRTFKREVNALIAQGHRGRFAVILGDQIHGTWDTLRDALMVARELFQGKVCFVQEIQPYLRPMRWGYRRTCQD